MSAFVSRTMRSLIETNAFCRGPDTRPGLMVNGGACQGKTKTACEALACYEDEWLALYARNPDAVAGTLDLHVRGRLRPHPGQGHPDLPLPADPAFLRRTVQGHEAGRPDPHSRGRRSSTTAPRRS